LYVSKAAFVGVMNVKFNSIKTQGIIHIKIYKSMWALIRDPLSSNRRYSGEKCRL